LKIFNIFDYTVKNQNGCELDDDLKIWDVAIYARVSSDKDTQAASIPAQIESMRYWITQQGQLEKTSIYNVVDEYVDQISGSVDDRKNFIRMLDDAKNGRINMIIVRDLSRFSRHLNTSEEYQQEKFAEWGIRFVAVLDNYDNLKEVNDFSSFQNLINNQYLKDCSKKSKDGLKSRMRQGSSIASMAPYGYCKKVTRLSPVKKHIELVIADDHTPDVVREIYDLYLSGWGYGRIATHLNSKSIEPPGIKARSAKAMHNLWQPNCIREILKNPKYAGVMAQGQWQKVSYKSKHSKKVDPSKWIIGGEFEGIVSKDTFHAVQLALQQRTKHRYKGDVIHPFTTVLKCNECGGSMTYRKEYQGYKCHSSQVGGKRCTSHSVKEHYLINTVKNNLKEYMDNINRNPYYNKADNLIKKNSLEKDISKVNAELKKLERDIIQTYQDRLDGVMSVEVVSKILKNIQDKQQTLTDKKDRIEYQMLQNNNNIDLINRYKEEIDKLFELEQIDRQLVEALIDKIIVSEDTSNKTKTIDIYYKFNNSL
jgi:DNA invertase Pin-like site-specific DNA recombinase